MPPLIDISGQSFGRLAVLSRANNVGRYTAWDCLCVCGVRKIIPGHDLTSQKTVSCGCFRDDNARARLTTHGMRHSKIYTIWCGMKQRCSDPNFKDFNLYGGRGISVCKRWLKFENFFADMGHPPSGLTLDRIDPDGNYKPGNCRWATWRQQRLNQRQVPHDRRE